MNRRILIAGDWKMPHYEEALAAGFLECGWQVTPFKITDFLGARLASRVEKKLLFGPGMSACNRGLLQAVHHEKPDAVLLFKPIYVFEETARKIKSRTSCILISQCNDNPYDDGERFRLWRHYHKVIRHCDLNYFSRPSDLEHARRESIQNARWLKFFYVRGVHRPMPDSDSKREDCAVFIGHYEPDGRDQLLEYLLASGVNLRVFGPGWNRAPNHGLLQQQKIRPLFGEDYVRTLAGAAIGLVLLSQRNKDLYTTRCFEIPACKTLMLAPRTPILQQMYRDDEEAVFYEGREDLLEKLRYYLSHDSERQMIADAGYRRCMADGNSNIDRARLIISDIEEMASSKCRNPFVATAAP